VHRADLEQPGAEPSTPELFAMTSTSKPSASATGRLDSLPMCELLAYALYRKLDGCFVFETLEREKSVFAVSQGHVTKVRTARPVLALGELLIASSTLDQTSLARALALATSEGARLGDTLVQQRLLSAAALQDALRDQLARRVAWIGCLPPSTSFAYYGGVDLLKECAAVETDPLRVIARSLREAPPGERIERVMARVRGQSVRLPAGVELERLELTREQAAFAALLRQAPEGQPLKPPSTDLSPAVRQLMYLLVLTRQLQLAPLKDAAPATSRTSHLSGTLRTPSERSLPGDDASRRSTLPPPSSLRRPGSLPPSSAPPGQLSASAAFRAAQECVKRHQLDRAQALAEQACRLDGAEVESQALLAWIQAQREDLRNARLAHSILSELNQAIRKEPNNPRIRFYRGQVLKRLGRTEDALKDFRFSARQDPENLDAIRELRVHNMRSEPPPARASGVFSKLFGR
jgi:tetratricopeptide (TPR) repeat protein